MTPMGFGIASLSQVHEGCHEIHHMTYLMGDTPFFDSDSLGPECDQGGTGAAFKRFHLPVPEGRVGNLRPLRTNGRECGLRTGRHLFIDWVSSLFSTPRGFSRF